MVLFVWKEIKLDFCEIYHSKRINKVGYCGKRKGEHEYQAILTHS